MRWLALAVFAVFCGAAWIQLWLPRMAHAAFSSGKWKRATRYYRLIGALAFRARRKRSAVLSRGACAVGAGDHEQAAALLSALDGTELETVEHAVLLNNRACLSLDTGASPADALALVDRAIELRPDVPALQHTRARALLAVGRTDDAIAVLDGMRAGGELAPWLESERCRELATAWEAKGQAEYAAEYRARAKVVAR
ncbi:MAG TPA: tetratricopeptide repeat protein [Kofleriaceae bacterium]|jgi:predicted Zn-dependent protease